MFIFTTKLKLREWDIQFADAQLFNLYNHENFNKINLSLPANRTCFNPTLSPVKGERSGSTVRQLISSLKEITHNEQPKIQYLNLQSNQQTLHTKPPTNFVFEGPNKVFMQHKSDNVEE